MKPGHKKAGHFQIQPSKRAAGEACLVGKRPNCFTGLDRVTGCPPGLSKFPGCPSRSCCTPLTPDSGGNGPHAHLSSPLFSSLSFLPAPNPRRKTLSITSQLRPRAMECEVRGSSGRSAKNRWCGILEPHCFPCSAHRSRMAASTGTFGGVVSPCTENKKWPNIVL